MACCNSETNEEIKEDTNNGCGAGSSSYSIAVVKGGGECEMINSFENKAVAPSVWE